MIIGSVTGLRALIPLIVTNAVGDEIELESVLDTGFTGFLTLPHSLILSLSLPRVNQMDAWLAGNRHEVVDVHAGSVRWESAVRTVDVLALNEDPLIGLSLLRSCEVRMQVDEGGLVEIEPV